MCKLRFLKTLLAFLQHTLQSSQPLENLGQILEIYHVRRQVVKCKECKCVFWDRPLVFLTFNKEN